MIACTQGPKGAEGSVLLISLIMLMVMTLLGLSAIKMSTVNLRTINNMQVRGEAMATAQNVADQILSYNFADDIGNFTETDTKWPTTDAGTTQYGRHYTVAVDAGKSYTVFALRPCIQSVTPITNIALDISNTLEAKCLDTLTNPYSACATTVWQIGTKLQDGWFGANVSITQGTGIMMDSGAAAAYSSNTAYRCSS